MPNAHINRRKLKYKPTTIRSNSTEPHNGSEKDTENEIEREKQIVQCKGKKRAQAYYMRLNKMKSNQFHYRYIGRDGGGSGGGGGTVSWHRLMFFAKFKEPYFTLPSRRTHSTRARTCNEL